MNVASSCTLLVLVLEAHQPWSSTQHERRHNLTEPHLPVTHDKDDTIDSIFDTCNELTLAHSNAVLLERIDFRVRQAFFFLFLLQDRFNARDLLCSCHLRLRASRKK